MENIIKKAIEGGWNAMRPEKEATVTFRMFTETEYGNGAVFIETTFVEDDKDNGRNITLRSEEVFCDPLFWQALQKSCEWKDADRCGSCGDEVVDMGWRYHGIHFMEINLSEGFQSAVEWLENIIK